MKRRLMLFLMCMASTVLAELPPDVDEVLFDLTHGTNYVQWVASTGVVKYVRNFGPFDGGTFRSYIDAENPIGLRYAIAMEREFSDSVTFTQVVDALKDVGKTLTLRFGQARFSTVETECLYRSTCRDVDGRGWDVSFCVCGATNGSPLKATALFYNPLHEKGKWTSCPDRQ